MIFEPFRYFRLYRRKERRIRPSNQRGRLVRCIRRSFAIMRAGECLYGARDVDVFLPQAQFGCNLGSHLILDHKALPYDFRLTSLFTLLSLQSKERRSDVTSEHKTLLEAFQPWLTRLLLLRMVNLRRKE